MRVALLELMRTEYPGALDMKTLQFSMDSLGYPMSDGQIEAHIEYLKEKGYVQVKKHESHGHSVVFASMTARGWDLLDGVTSEDGVDRAL